MSDMVVSDMDRFYVLSNLGSIELKFGRIHFTKCIECKNISYYFENGVDIDLSVLDSLDEVAYFGESGEFILRHPRIVDDASDYEEWQIVEDMGGEYLVCREHIPIQYAVDYSVSASLCIDCHLIRIVLDGTRVKDMYFRKVRDISKAFIRMNKVDKVYDHVFSDGAVVYARVFSFGTFGIVISEGGFSVDDVKFERGVWEFYHPAPK